MKLGYSLLVSLVAASSTAALAQESEEGAAAAAVVQPGPAPTAAVPAPTVVPPPPQAQVPAASVARPGVPEGQWVRTAQYGWVWMPYAQQYTSVPASGNPLMYVYGPSLGWSWVAAPWVFGWGPVPYWGSWGLARYAWYARPWFRPRWGGWAGWHGGWGYRGYGGYGLHSGFRGGGHGRH